MFSTQPEYAHQEEFKNRSKKLAEIRALGIDPYPPKYVHTRKAADLAVEYEGKEIGPFEEAAEGRTPHVFVSGRMVLFRAMGKNSFAQIQDETGRIQILCNRDQTGVAGLKSGSELTPIKFIEKKLDLGDFIGVEGFLFRTHTGELTVFAKSVTLLCKSLLPLPDKHSGLVDKGVRYRKRWLDLISHPESLERFRRRSRILFTLRKFMEEESFEEVETAILENLYGGAAARPFKTHLNALSQDMFLRIALEIPLKKLIVGGMDRVYEIGKLFRNEGIDRTHNPEFTSLEAYAAGWDYNDMMDFVERLYERIALEIYGSTTVPMHVEGSSTPLQLNFKTPWIRISMKDSLKKYAQIDVDAMAIQEMRAKLLACKGSNAGVIKAASKGVLIAMLFEEFVEKHLVQPHLITDHPIETTPFCKPHRDPQLREQGLIERFEGFALGRELCNAYTELNDPELQRHLFEDQVRRREQGDEEANPMDEEFLEAICQGMPPTGGIGIGIDRLVMLFTSAESIRDVILFPLMRPEDS